MFPSEEGQGPDPVTEHPGFMLRPVSVTFFRPDASLTYRVHGTASCHWLVGQGRARLGLGVWNLGLWFASHHCVQLRSAIRASASSRRREGRCFWNHNRGKAECGVPQARLQPAASNVPKLRGHAPAQISSTPPRNIGTSTTLSLEACGTHARTPTRPHARTDTEKWVHPARSISLLPTASTWGLIP